MRRFTRGAVRGHAGRLLAAALLVGTVAACDNGGDTASKTLQPLPAEWSASGKRTVEKVAKQIQGSDANRCARVSYLDPPSLEAARQRYEWNIAPEALGDCMYDTSDDPEVLEIGAFRTAADRDAFMDERTNSICRRAAAVQAEIPPFAWVTGDAWSVQADKRATAQQVAKATGGKIDVRPCDLKDTLGWTEQGAKTVRSIAGKMSGAVPCSGFGLLDRDAVTQDTKGLATPAAIGACTISGATASGGTGASGATGSTASSTVLVAAFDGKSQSRAQFLEEALTGEAVCARPATAVIGTRDGVEWAVVVPSEYAQGAATALGGTVGRTCG